MCELLLELKAFQSYSQASAHWFRVLAMLHCVCVSYDLSPTTCYEQSAHKSPLDKP